MRGPRAAGATFTGFADEDFAVFAIPGFAKRMPELRARLTPKLTAIGQRLNGDVSAVLHAQLYPHVARHLRRTINPPDATWVAFAPSARAYKPFTHVRFSLDLAGIRVTIFVEDDADDKPAFGSGLKRSARTLSRLASAHPEITCFDLLDSKGNAAAGRALTETAIRNFGARLLRVRGQHASFGARIARDEAVQMRPEEVFGRTLAITETLRPFYECGRDR